jgi:hypothetical protein
VNLCAGGHVSQHALIAERRERSTTTAAQQGRANHRLRRPQREDAPECFDRQVADIDLVARGSHAGGKHAPQQGRLFAELLLSLAAVAII